MSDKPKETFVEIEKETSPHEKQRTLTEKLTKFLATRHVPSVHAQKILKLAKAEIEKAFPNQDLRWNEKGLHYSPNAFTEFRNITARVAINYLEEHEIPHKNLAICCLDQKYFDHTPLPRSYS